MSNNPSQPGLANSHTTTTSRPTLALFLSNGGSLCAWEKANILSREIALYLEMLRAGDVEKVLVFSYDHADVDYVARARSENPAYDQLLVVTPPKWMGRLKGVRAAVYSVYGVFAHKSVLRQADWFKTNQMSGAWAAVLAKWATNRLLLVRQGYMLSRRFTKNGQPFKAWLAQMVEQIAYKHADVVAVTSEGIAQQLSRQPHLQDKTRLLPTYIDTSKFVPKTENRFDEPILYVGRLEPQKNLEALITACALAGHALDIVGSGSLEDSLRELAVSVGADVRFLGSFPNDRLPDVLKAHSVFALVSHHEGLPKVLIEAMGCGLVCIGSPIPGNTDLIENGKTGYLTEDLSAEKISETIRQVFADKNNEIGRAAGKKVAENFSLETYASNEAQIYRAH